MKQHFFRTIPKRKLQCFVLLIILLLRIRFHYDNFTQMTEYKDEVMTFWERHDCKLQQRELHILTLKRMSSSINTVDIL